MNVLKIKVCGMREPDNIRGLIKLKPDYAGFIFYPPSKRYVGSDEPNEIFHCFPPTIKTAGVFVNEKTTIILQKGEAYNLNVIQLHGNESPEQCKDIKNAGFEVFKAFSVDENFDFSKTKAYSKIVDYFLFDTKTPKHGGSGIKFNWDVLSKYEDDTPFFLSGGIDETDIPALIEIQSEAFFGLDINSRFEHSPGVKDIQKTGRFINHVRKLNDNELSR